LVKRGGGKKKEKREKEDRPRLIKSYPLTGRGGKKKRKGGEFLQYPCGPRGKKGSHETL